VGRIGAIGRFVQLTGVSSEWCRTSKKGRTRRIACRRLNARVRAGAGSELAEFVRQRLAPAELFVTEFTNAMAVHTGPGFLRLAWQSGAPPSGGRWSPPFVLASARRKGSRLTRAAAAPVKRPALVVLAAYPAAANRPRSRDRTPPTSHHSRKRCLRRALVKQPTYSQRRRQTLRGLPRITGGPAQRRSSGPSRRNEPQEMHRRPLYRIAERTGPPLAGQVRADADVVRRRLAHRASSDNPWDRSDATLDVYESMRREAEPMRRKHLTVDTSADIGPAVDRIVGELARVQV
jgi:hypothetical protein